MGWLNNPPYDIAEAVQRGDDLYEVLYSGWGWGTAPSDQWPPNGQPSVPVSLAGISIGPRSTVDRAWLSYNLQKPAPNIVDLSGLTNRLRQVSLDAPLLFGQPAAPRTAQTSALAAMVKTGSLYVWPSGITSGVGGDDGYAFQNQTSGKNYTDINGVARTLDGSGGGAPNVIGPLLHLYLYLKAPLLAPPTKRAPLKASGSTNGALFQANVEGQLAVIATFGRRRAHLMVQATQACSFRVGGVRVMSGGPLEEPIDSALNVAANTPTILSSCAGDGILADYTIIYINAPSVNNLTINYTFSAYD